MPRTHPLTQALFLGVEAEQSKQEMWDLFDGLAFKLLLRSQVQGGLQGDEGDSFWTVLHEKYPKILLVTAVTTDKTHVGIFVSSDAVDSVFQAIREEQRPDLREGSQVMAELLTRFLIDHPHVPVLQATAMFLTVMAIIDMSKEEEDPQIPFPSAYVYIRQPPPLDEVVPVELF